MVKILLVEDDNMIASGIQYALEMENYEVCHVINIHDALIAINKADFNLAILDMQLPDGVGFEVSEKLKTVNTAIIFLTVVDDENTIVKAFDDGATDYIVKPFEAKEVVARIKAVLRRTGETKSSEDKKVEYDKLSINLVNYELRVN